MFVFALTRGFARMTAPSLGRSDSQTGLRTSGQMAEQLHTLLASAKVPGLTLSLDIHSVA